MQTTAPARIELNSGPDGSVVLHALALPIAEKAAGAGAAIVPVQVIPPPGPDGLLPTRDGRRNRVTDIAALVARLNRQEIAARVDVDHHSEPGSPNYRGATAAEGWLSNYRLDRAGGITADMELGPDLREKIREKRYRYISPALFLAKDGEVRGLSSIALVNDPNMPLAVPAIHSLHAREAELARRQAALERENNQAAEMVVNTAIFNGDIAAHHRNHHLDAIRSHEDGIGAGINSFVELGRAGGFSPPVRFTVPEGCEEPTPTRRELHNQIAHRASRQGVTYREAANQVAAETCELAVPAGWQAPREARMALHREISANALESGTSYRETAARMEDHARISVPPGAHPPREERMALHASISRFAVALGIPYREAITRRAGASPNALQLHAMAAYENTRASVKRLIEQVTQHQSDELAGRAKRVAEIAEELASAGRWEDALAAVKQARDMLDAADRLATGDASSYLSWMEFPHPTPETVGKSYAQLVEAGLWPHLRRGGGLRARRGDRGRRRAS